MITIGLLVAGLAVLAVAVDALTAALGLGGLAYWIMSPRRIGALRDPRETHAEPAP